MSNTSTIQTKEPETKTTLAVTEAALVKVRQIRESEDDSDTLGLRVEIIGTQGADYTYDLCFEPVAEAPDDADIYEVEDLTVIIPANSIENLAGSTLDIPSNPMHGGLVIKNPNRPDLFQGKNLELKGELAEKLQQLLADHINPSLAAHGGFAVLENVEDTVVYISMGGGCQGCAMSAATLREGITAMISQALPEVTQVVDVTDHEAGENPYY